MSNDPISIAYPFRKDRFFLEYQPFGAMILYDD